MGEVSMKKGSDVILADPEDDENRQGLPTTKEDFKRTSGRYQPKSDIVASEYRLTPRIDTESGQELIGRNDGWVTGARGNELLRFPTEKHMITFGTIGSGKGVSVAIPNMLMHEGSAFLMEMSTTTYKTTSNFRRHVMKQKVYLIDPWGATDEGTETINLLDTLNADDPEFHTQAIAFAETLMKDVEVTSRDGGSSYFENTAKELLAALLIYLKKTNNIAEEDKHLPKLFEIINSAGTDEWHDLMQEMALDSGEDRLLFNKVGNYFYGRDDENVRSIFSSMGQKFLPLLDPAVTKMLKKSSFSLEELRDGNTTVYVVAPSATQMRKCPVLFRLLVERTIAAYPYMGDGGQNYKTTKSRLLMMLDEFPQLGKVEGIDGEMAVLRAKGITIWLLAQDLSQLIKIYGEHVANSILANAGVIQVLRSHDPATLKWMSEFMGENITVIPQVQQSVAIGDSKQLSFTDTVSMGKSKVLSTSETLTEGESWQTSKSISTSNSVQNSNSTSTAKTTGGNTTKSHASQWNDNYGTTVSTNFIKPGMKAGDVNVAGLFGGRPDATGASISHSYNRSYGGTNTTSETSINSDTTTSTNTRTSGQTITEGTTTSKGGNRSVAHGTSTANGTNENTSYAKGKVIGANETITYSVSYTTQIIPNLKPTQIEDVLVDGNQILIIRAEGKMLRIVERKANFYEIPSLNLRATGPRVLDSPILLGDLEPPKALSYSPSMHWDFNAPAFEKVRVTYPDTNQAFDAYDIPQRRFSLGTSDIKKLVREIDALDGLTGEDKKKKIREKNDIFLRVAQDIQTRNTEVSSKNDQEDLRLAQQWADMDAQKDALVSSKRSLSTLRANVSKKREILKEFEGALFDYQKQLRSDSISETEYERLQARYRGYLQFVHDIKQGWRDIDTPERPEPLPVESEYLQGRRDGDLEHLINAGIAEFTKEIPAIPDDPIKPERKVAPEYRVALPLQILATMKAKMSTGVVLSYSNLCELRSGPRKFAESLKKSNQIQRASLIKDLTEAECASALDNMVDLAERETTKLLKEMPFNQSRFLAWQKKDAESLVGYSCAIEDFREKMLHVAKELKDIEGLMDRHWEHLARRYDQLNIANLILQNRRAQAHNQMCEWHEWDGIEAINFLEAPDVESIQYSPDTRANDNRIGEFEDIRHLPDQGAPTRKLGPV